MRDWIRRFIAWMDDDGLYVAASDLRWIIDTTNDLPELLSEVRGWLARNG